MTEMSTPELTVVIVISLGRGTGERSEFSIVQLSAIVGGEIRVAGTLRVRSNAVFARPGKSAQASSVRSLKIETYRR